METNIFSLKGATAIVTGAGRGNGWAIAKGLYEYGARVLSIDLVHEETLDAPHFHQIIGDARDTAFIKRICEQAYTKGSGRDILVNNAGITQVKEGKYPRKAWDETLAINLTAAFEWTREAAEWMKKAQGGSIINITSLGASLGFPNNPAYVASKGGLKMMSKAFARDLGKYNIRVNNIAPGYIKTNMTKASYEDDAKRTAREAHMILKRWGNPEDLVGAAVFLASPAAAYITGQDIHVDGGWTANGLI